MTQIQCYLNNTYCFLSTGEVIASGSDEWGQWIALNKNLFHPQGGGQPADIGWVNNVPVKVRKQATGQIVVYPESTLHAPLGAQLNSKLSEEARICHAALHTAGHLLNWEMRQYGWMAISGHHFPGESRVEFSPIGSSAIPSDQLSLQNIETTINTKLRDGGQVTTWYEADTRLCLIEGTEPMPCAGTHVDNLNKINEFTIKSVKFKKGTLRISYDASHIILRTDNVS
ncbi:hypothetical protein KKI90_19700 [Xenorhabdus bovienii]|uniref:Alanyl-tRNA synthetase n=1 Tax=Xenorhabdus bovienii TaxID=40576 RepID=A0AAJ1N0B3_XENBV|nr:hypothetical protein [Xenorhabdus bovienii]MDE1477852.1 hypothetical protein [Xenorhabdus bovienii]MDE1488502.1 hypothetical protein [Xenorhabdus bovienii]MDE1490704.1 hypothetical protein [Xenorhabdus bovienii]MDE1495893.1 hypothetical protein [Xenorhabdus bovienii]MDE9473798.1 hypothetical protein [Xenorhabdus bovienii]